MELINEYKFSLGEVLAILEKQKNGTEWAKISNDWAKRQAEKFSSINNGNWVKGELPEKYLGEILLPKHLHKDEDGDAPFTIPENTHSSRVLDIYKQRTNRSSSKCLQNIEHLRELIKANGFTEEIILGANDGKLHHVDGLHRLIALISLLDEGMIYSPIPACLSKPSQERVG